MFQHNSIDYYMNMASPFIEKYQSLRHHRIMIKIDFNNLKIYETKHPNDSVCELLTTPYWFKVK
jgi:protein associated with RNAse G/E